MTNRRRLVIVSCAASAVLLVGAISLLSGAGTPPSTPPPAVVPSAPAPTPPAAAEPSARPPEPEPGPEPDGNTGEAAPVFREWLAFGSGCRARSTQPGDVTMERFTLDSGSKVVHRARFHLDRYELTTMDRTDEQPLDFARECAVRVQLVPPAGKRIAGVTARTRVVSTKSESTRLTILGELKLGAASIGRKLLVYEAGAEQVAREDVLRLAPGASPEEAMPEVACGAGKLVGFDYTWIAERPAAADEAFVKLSGKRVLDIDAELADCETARGER